MFLYYTRHGMNFYSCEKRIFKFVSCTKICNGSKWTKTNGNRKMQPTASNIDSRPIFPYHVHNQACFDNPFINGRSFIYFGTSKKIFAFQVFTRFKIAHHQRQLERPIFDYIWACLGNSKTYCHRRFLEI